MSKVLINEMNLLQEELNWLNRIDYNLYEDHEFLAGLSPLREEERRYLESVHNTRPMPTPTSLFVPILSTSENHVYSDPTLPAVNPQEIFTSEAGGKKMDNKERKRVEPSVK